MTELKRCSCAEHEGPNPLPLTGFSKRRNGLQSWCKACMNRANQRLHAANLEQQRERNRAWKKANPGKVGETQRRYRAAHPEYRQSLNRKRNQRSIRDNAVSRDTATHYREPWTIRQLEVATQPGLTARQAAEILGRTISAVHNARRRLRAEPSGAVQTEVMEDTWT